MPEVLDQAPEFIGIRQADAIQPMATHRHRVVVQAHHDMLVARERQLALEARKFWCGDSPLGATLLQGVQHDDFPVPETVRPADGEGRRGQFPSHCRQVVVISRNAQHGPVQ